MSTAHPADADGHRASSSRIVGSSPLGRGISRAISLITIATMLFGGLAFLAAPAAAQAQATTTASLNLRSGPGMDASIITVMPAGAAVSIDGDPQNGFYPVTYNGRSGYAHGDYLAIGSGGGVTGGGPTGTAIVVGGALNLRSGPGLDHPVITVMPDGARVELTGESGNGFLGVVYNGTRGFAYADYLSVGGPGSGSGNTGGGSGGVAVGDSPVGSATVTSALNMRSGPGTDYQVVMVLPAGASVEIMGDPQAGFYPVRYNGTKGWSHGDWLSAGGGAAPQAPSGGGVAVGDTVVGSATVTSALNLRTGPGTSYAIVLVMPAGAAVEVMGDPQGGFYPLRYNGTKGWASGDWLRLGSGAPAPAPAPSAEDAIIAIIYEAADHYGQPREDMLRVARCESLLDPNAVNPVSNASGLFQFLPSTWATTPYADQDIFDARANAYAAAWMWSVGRRNEWTCQ